MDRKLKRLPTCIQTFERIINENRLYVDKTQMLTELIDEGGQYFFARPRRFGMAIDNEQRQITEYTPKQLNINVI
jgi:hypothetical protein